MLAAFREAKQAEIAALKAHGAPKPLEMTRPGFAAALLERGPGAVIAEYKRASPSKGDINLGLEPEAVADIYAAAGAAAISVLTEERYFKGALGYLERMTGPGLPLLRKDFLFDPLQVAATAATPASAYLLIVRYFGSVEELAAMIDAGTPLGLEAVVEVFGEEETRLAKAAGARIIQVNNRDLDTLTTDLNVARRLIALKKPGEAWIAASGIATPDHAREFAALGYEGLLVGTGLMAADSPGAALASLVKAGKAA